MDEAAGGLMHCLNSLLVVLLSTAVTGQTFIVDAANGPGTNFADLPTAVAAVPDGAVLRVRSGSYAGFAMSGKGLVILGDANATITSPIHIDNTNSQQANALRNLVLTPLPSTPCLHFTNCAGPLLLEAVSNPTMCDWLLDATLCAQLAVRGCTLWGQVTMSSCKAVVESSLLTGLGGFWYFDSSPGLWANHCDLQIVASSVTGGSRYHPLAGIIDEPGIVMGFGDLRLLASTVQTAQNVSVVPAVSNIAMTRVDLTTVLVGSSPVSGPVRYMAMPRVTCTGAQLGGMLTATTETELGDVVALVVGLPGAPTLLSGFQDAFWLDPAVHVFHTIGVQQQGVPVSGSIAVPNVADFAGLRLVWHAVCFGPVTGLQNSNPSVSLIRL